MEAEAHSDDAKAPVPNKKKAKIAGQKLSFADDEAE
jgi:hypothetical protein